MIAEALQPLQRALRSQESGNAPRSTGSTPPQSRPATPQLNPPPRGAWQNRSQRNDQGPTAGNANQSGSPRTFTQPQSRGSNDGRSYTPPNTQRNQQQFRQSPVTPPGPACQRRGCYVCGAFGCHTTTTVTTHVSTPTRAFSPRRQMANVVYRRKTRMGIRARATGFRRSSARVQLR